jgi:hypothetical protein
VRLPPRLDAIPRHWYFLTIGVVVAALVVVAGLLQGNGSVATTDPTPPSVGSTTSPPEGSDGIATSDRVASEGPAVASTTTTTIDPDILYAEPPEQETADPKVVARPIPDEPGSDAVPPATTAPPPWAASTRTTAAGYLAADVGCAAGLDAAALDAFFADRVGPAIGWDYQHVYPLGGNRYLWVFQDAFLDHSGVVGNLGQARFVHNAALLQTGTCFTLLHRGSADRPGPFEDGNGAGDLRSKWYWPLGGETIDGKLSVFWAEMVKDPVDPQPPDGLGWHPNRVFIGTYDPTTLARLSFLPAPDDGVDPLYGYAVASDAQYTYLFGNSFEQNLTREGGFWSGRHSATKMYLSRIPRGRFTAYPEYRTADGWTINRWDAVPISDRYYAENPMQPRLLDGQWVAATKVDGYWGEDLVIDVAVAPWGPWSTVDQFRLEPRGNDPLKNTYHAHLMPWRDDLGSVVVMVSNNARNMLRDAWARPDRYRPMVTYSAYRQAPPPEITVPGAPTTLGPTTTVGDGTVPGEVTTTPTAAPTTSQVQGPTTTIKSSTTTRPPTTTDPPTTTRAPTTTRPPTTTTDPPTTTTEPPTTTTEPPTTTTEPPVVTDPPDPPDPPDPFDPLGALIRLLL